MKKLFIVGIYYMTRKGNLGSKTYYIEAKNHENALAKGRKKADKRGRSKFSADCVEAPPQNYLIIANRIPDYNQLDHDDQDNLEEIESPYRTTATSRDEALDHYHCNIPIAVLDDFEITCEIEK